MNPYQKLGLAILLSAIMEQWDRYSRTRIDHPTSNKLLYLTLHAQYYVNSKAFERLAKLCGFSVKELRKLTPKQASQLLDGRKKERRGRRKNAK